MKNLKKTARQTLLLAFVASLISLTSCGDDDTVSSLPLVGTTWIEFSDEVNCKDEENSEGVEFCEEGCIVIVFNDDGTFSVPEEEVEGAINTYSVDGDELTLVTKFGEFEVSTTFDFVIIGDKLTLNDFDDQDYDPEMGCVVTSTFQGK